MSESIITRKMVESIIEETIGGRLTRIEDSMKEINRALLGDGTYNKIGMKDQHDEMYRAYFTYKEDLFPARLSELWDNYQDKKKNKLDEKVSEVVGVYANIKWMQKFFGITSVLAFLASLLSIIITGYTLYRLIKVE